MLDLNSALVGLLRVIFQPVQQVDGQQKARIFLASYLFVEIANFAVLELFTEGALRFAAAQGARNDPAGPAGVFSVMDSVKSHIDRCRAYARCRRISSAGLSSAIMKFPAILFHRYDTPSLVHSRSPGVLLLSAARDCVFAREPCVLQFSDRSFHAQPGG